jgi:hypothetical protein
MLDDVAAVAQTAGQPPTRSPNTKAAVAYLTASGATAITITADADGIAISVGIKRDAVAAYWLPETMVRSVAAKARNIMGDAGGVEEAISALQEAAAKCAVTLTPHDVAISRAVAATDRLDAYVEALRARGAMKEFTKTYKRRRMEAKANGLGFMSYAVAEARLRKALIPLLVGGRNVGSTQSLFAEIFRTE